MRVTIATCSAVVSLALAGEAVLAASEYPNRTVKIIVPTSPGAVTDVLARALAQALSRTWGQSVIVENRPGGDEMIGDEMVAKAKPDGYTLGVVSNSGITAAPLLHRNVRYDPVKDFTPIDMLGQITPVMVVPAKSPVHTVQELIALAKSEPGQLNFGSFGTGSYAHVAMEDFMRRTGIKMTHVPYHGATPAYEALIRGDVAVMIANLGSAHAQEQAGFVRIIAAAGPHRSNSRPGLPTIAESAVPGFSTGAWWGMFGPAKIPAPVVNRIVADLSRNLDTPQMEKIYQANTMEREDMGRDQFVQFIRTDIKNWARQIKAVGVTPN
jgi:tripartite-type tricarboxylate transporter receptor subunit TctC